MPDERLNRRRLLAASLGAAATLPLVASSPPTALARTGAADLPRPEVSRARNVRDFGAVGDGRADDTEAIARACRAGEGPGVLYLPGGTYLVTQWPELPDFSTVTGDGGDLTTIVYEGDGTLISLSDRQRVAFERLGVYVSGPGATAVRLSGCFRSSGLAGVVLEATDQQREPAGRVEHILVLGQRQSHCSRKGATP